MSSNDGPNEGAPPAAPRDPEAPAAAPEIVIAAETKAIGDDSPIVEVGKDDAPVIGTRSGDDDSGPVIELGVDAFDLPNPGPPPAIEVPSFLAASAENTAHAPPIAPIPTEPRYAPSMLFLGLVAGISAVADIASKEWAKWALAGPELKRSAKHIEVIPNHLDFIFAQNPGGAWSFLRSVPDGIRRPFFLFVSAAAIVFIVSVYGKLEKRQWAMRWGLPLALGGAIGNLQDRVRYGWVVDFIDVYYKGGANEVHWPTFNVADIAIVVGVGLMALDLLSLRHGGTHAPSEPKTETAGGAA